MARLTTPARPTTRFRRDLRWLVPALAALTGLGVWLFALDPEAQGAVTDILEVLVAIVGVIVAVLLRPPAPPAEVGRSLVGPARSRRWLVGRAVFVAVLVILLSVTGFAVWRYATKSAITVTHELVLRDGESVPDGGVVHVGVPGEPPRRGHLELVPVLHNTDITGNCVDPAELTVTAVVDGQPGESAVVHSGESVDLSIEGARRDASVTITINQRDPACVVDLTVDRAFLHD